MKTTLFFILFLTSTRLLCQQDSSRQRLYILENQDFFLTHNILLGNYKFDNPDLNLTLGSALRYRDKRKSNNLWGGILLGYGAITIITGIAVKSESRNNNSFAGGFAESLFGTLFISTGVITAGASIPIFISARKKKENMERSLNLARELYGKQ